MLIVRFRTHESLLSLNQLFELEVLVVTNYDKLRLSTVLTNLLDTVIQQFQGK